MQRVSRDLSGWRAVARSLLEIGASPEDIHWLDEEAAPSLLEQMSGETTGVLPGKPFASGGSVDVRVSRSFLECARYVLRHRDSVRLQTLYRVLWRLVHGEVHLLDLEGDPDVHRLRSLEREVRQDVDRMRAFVRFRRVVDDHSESFVAFHRSDHPILPLVVPFFTNRFPGMRWAILTPDESVHYDGERIRFGVGASPRSAPSHDELEELWRGYYESVFNPSRVNLRLMHTHMPKRYWTTLPETQSVPELVRGASRDTRAMRDRAKALARTHDFLPTVRSLPVLRAAAMECRGCDLHDKATQTVFGEGPANARVILIGEQPGDLEDGAGRPFVGPAGRMLDRALAEAAVDRASIYVTNAVKHFRFEQRGKRRIHQRPNANEVRACRPWLEAELEVIRPEMLICLGATAARAIFGGTFRLTSERGRLQGTPFTTMGLATWHPSSILRLARLEHRQRAYDEIVEDLRAAAEWLQAESSRKSDSRS